MEVQLLAEIANAGAGVALVFTAIWIVVRCKIRVDCNDDKPQNDA